MKKYCAQPAPPTPGITDDPGLRTARFAAFCVAVLGAAFSVSLCAIGVGLYAALLCVSLMRRREVFPIFPHVVFLLPLALSTGISAILSQYPDESIRGILKFSQGIFLCYAGFELIRERRDLDRFVMFFTGCQVLASMSALWQEQSGFDFINHRSPTQYTEQITRLTGPFNHCNDFATFLLPGLVLALVYGVDAWVGARRRSGALWAAITLMLTYVMIRTMSRGAFISLLAALLILAAGSRWRGRILTISASAAALLLSVPSSFRTRLVELFSPHGSGLQERWYLLKGTWKMVEASPWFGLGPNTYSRWFPIFNPPDAQYPILMYAHNSYAQIAAETGLMGLSLTVLFWSLGVGSGVRSAIRSSGEDRWIRCGFVAVTAGVLVNAFFDSLIQSTQLRTLFWILFGVMAALSRRDNIRDQRPA